MLTQNLDNNIKQKCRISSVWEEVRFYITIPKQSFGSVWTVVEKRDFREVYGPLNGHDSPGAAPVRLQVCVNSRSGFPVRLCSETLSRLDALAVFLILDRDSLSAVRNEWNFLKLLLLFFLKEYILPIKCAASTVSVLQNGGLEVNPSGHHDDRKARGFDLNGHSSRSPLNRVLHGAAQLQLLKTTKCSF